jgi:hypothetical protein
MASDASASGAERTRRAHQSLSGFLVVTGIAIAVVNMALAWTIMFTRPLGPPITAPVAQTSVGAKSDGAADVIGPMIRAAEAQQVGEQNILILCVAFAFAVLSIGFSLFVMGIEGALSVQGEVADFGRLVVRTASPGVLCIVLALAVILTLLVLTQVRFGDTQEAAKAELIRAEAQAKTEQTIALQAARFDLQLKEESAKLERKLEEDRIKFEQKLEQDRQQFEREFRQDPARPVSKPAPTRNQRPRP